MLGQSKKVFLVAVLFSLALGACSKKASAGKSVSLCDFERRPNLAMESPHFDPATALKEPQYPVHDFRWSTAGYAAMDAYTKDQAKAEKNKELYKMLGGKGGARVRFSVPQDYKKRDERFPKTWETGLTLSIDSQTPLALTDWSEFSYLALDVYNAGVPQELRVRISDSQGKITQTAVSVVSGISTLELPLGMLSDARLNAADIKSLTFYLDTAGQDKDPVLIIDSLGLHQATLEARVKAASEDGEEAAEEEEDWDSEEEEGVKKELRVSRPGAPAAAPAPAAP